MYNQPVFILVLTEYPSWRVLGVFHTLKDADEAGSKWIKAQKKKVLEDRKLLSFLRQIILKTGFNSTREYKLHIVTSELHEGALK